MTSLWERYRALDHRNPYVTTAVITLFFTAFMGLDLGIKPSAESGFEQEGPLGIGLALAQVLPLVFVRKAPLITLIVIFAAFVTHSFLDFQVLWIAQFTTLIGVYQVAGTTNDRQSIIAGIMTFWVIVVVFGVIREDGDSTIALILLFAAVWIAGNVVRSRRGRLEIAELTVTELSEDRDLAMRDAIRDERARIAREMHDVLGHTLNLVVIQAGVAQRVFGTSPDKALEAVKSIESTSRQALSDVDRMLGILRDPDDVAGASPTLSARPSMSRLDALIKEIRVTGQPVDLTVRGTPVKLAPSIDLSIYRVVQEALTNVMTHAAGAKTLVEVDYKDTWLKVTITNDSSGVETHTERSSGGRGIVGMRERTALFDGKFQAESTDDGGWRVHAAFPLGGTK